MPSSTKSSSSHQALESCVEKAIVECKKHQYRRKWEKLANKLIHENLVVSKCEFDVNRKYDTLCGFKFNQIANILYNANDVGTCTQAGVVDNETFDSVAIPSLAALRQVDAKQEALLYVYQATAANINNELTGNFIPLLDDILRLKFDEDLGNGESLNEFEDALYTSDDKVIHDKRAEAEYIEQQEHVLAQIVEQFPYDAVGANNNIIYQNINYRNGCKNMTAVVGMVNLELCDSDPATQNTVIFWYAFDSC